MKDNTLVDTNILVYIIDKTEKQKHLHANKWLKSLKAKEKYFVALQNLREFSNIARKKSRLSAEEINSFLQVFSESFTVIFDNKDDLLKAVLLSEKTKTHFWDAILACTMQRHTIQKILTENTTDFKKISGIETINPLENLGLNAKQNGESNFEISDGTLESIKEARKNISKGKTRTSSHLKKELGF